jgi:hypothetical protein
LAAIALTCLLGVFARADSPNVLDLSGPWLVNTSDDARFGALKVPEAGKGWGNATLPAPVTSHGFIWYRKHFTVSNDWTLDRGVQNNKKLYLHLGKFSGAVWIYVNGYLVNKISRRRCRHRRQRRQVALLSR